MIRLLHGVLQALQLRSPDPGPTSIHFFTDDFCQNASFAVQTDTNLENGTCGSLTGDGVNSVNTSLLYPGCTVTTYLGPYCTDNATELALGICTSTPAGSYSVDCPDLNGTVNDTYTTIPASSSSSTLSASSPPSTFEIPTALSEQDTTTTVNSASLSAIVPSSPTTSGTASSSSSAPSSSAASSSVQTLTLSATGLRFPTSSPPSFFPSSTPSSHAIAGSSGGGGSNQIKTIGLPVLLPAVAVVVLGVMIYILWRRRKSFVKDKDDRNKAVEAGSPASLERRPSMEQNTADNGASRNPPTSDTESANSLFPSLPRFPQAELKNRTAEACSR